MKTSELRIGNIVMLDCKPVEVGYLVMNESNQCRPIPITEDWLIKMHFYKLHHFGNYEFTLQLDDPILGKQKSLLSIEVIHRKEDNCYLTRLVLEPEDDYEYQTSVNYQTLSHIKYVHQLQNLFFALTGEELIMKEPQPLQQ